MSNLTILNKRAIYQLRRTYGIKVILQIFESQTVDPTTGTAEQIEKEYKINAVVLAAMMSLPNIPMPNFSYGGNYELGDRQVLIYDADAVVKDVPMDSKFKIGVEKWNIVRQEAGEGYHWFQIRKAEKEQ
jgi:hypothetical protein